MSSRQLVNKGASGGVAECRMHARYQEVSVLTDLLLALGAKRSRYQTPYLEGVENRAHLVARDLYSLLQEPLIDHGAVKRAPRALPLLADNLAYLLGQFSSVVLGSHRTKITREGLKSNPRSRRRSLVRGGEEAVSGAARVGVGATGMPLIREKEIMIQFPRRPRSGNTPYAQAS
jgi:hypothetical protein